MDINSTTPVLTSNSFSFSVKDLANLFWGELIRKFWHIVLIAIGYVLFTVIMDLLRNPFPINLIWPTIAILAFIAARFIFISRLKKTPISNHSYIMSVFEDRIEFEDNKNNKRTFQLSEVVGLSNRKIAYIIRLRDKRLVYVSTNCFKSNEDKVCFENLLKK